MNRKASRLILSIVFNRKNKLNKQGKGSITIRAYYNAKNVFFDTKIDVLPNQWNSKRHEVINHPNAIELNNTINNQYQKLNDFYSKCIALNKNFSLELLKQFVEVGANTESFLYFYENELEHNKDIQKSTYITHLSTLKHLKNFSKNELNFSDVNYRMLKDFENYLYNQNLKENTINKVFRHFKTYINKAINKDVARYEQHPFKNFKAKLIQTKREYLTSNEIETLYNLEIPKEKEYLSESKDKFLFSCYVGLRLSDVCSLKIQDIENLFNGNEVIRKRMQKTSDMIVIPIYKLHPNATEILYKYIKASTDKQTIFKNNSSQVIGRHIKEIMILAGITKKISFHNSRHSFAMSLVNSKAVPQRAIQKILGHKKSTTTEVYTQMSENDFVNAFNELKF